MIPIILSGGSGTRLWPLSRTTYPKQFLTLAGEKTLFQATFSRLPDKNIQSPIIICNQEHRFLAARQLLDIGVTAEAIILEPIGRNTAPAIALAALHIEAQGREEVMLVLPADHIIRDLPVFHKALGAGEARAREGKIVTFGIVPDAPHTGFGYIQAAIRGNEGSDILAFKEKPDVITAQSYIDSGNYYWNSGMFMFSSSTYLQELKTYAPDIFKSCQEAYSEMYQDLDFLRLNEKIFSNCRSDSIDYAIMEKTEHAFVIPLNAGWSDLGAWSSIQDIKEKCPAGNVVEGDVIQHDCEGSYLYSDNKLIAAIGLKNMLVVDTLDAVLVAPMDRLQEVKGIVDELKSKGREEATLHRLVHRPWGTYDRVDIGERYQVKHITVYPGQKLSVQMHHHRAEHWIVVNGTAKVTCGEKTFIVKENESTYIPIGSIHALENPGETILELIEVQSGDYLGEDDIVRFEDRYGRQK